MASKELDDTDIYDLYVNYRASVLLIVANHLDLFGWLEKTPASTQEVMSQFDFSKRGADGLLNGLWTMGLLALDGDRYHLTEAAQAFLVPGRFGYLGGLIGLDFENFLTPEKLLSAMKKENTQVYQGGDVWEQHEADPDKTLLFTKAMHSISQRPAREIAKTLDFSKYGHLLDVGGGSGVYISEILKAHPHLKATLLDLGQVCMLAQQHFKKEGLSDRAGVAERDMFKEPYPGPVDVVLFSQILHDWEDHTNIDLLKKAYQALNPGGMVVISEKLLEDDHSGPLANALVNLDMLYWTKGRQYTAQELFDLLEGVGFRDAQVQKTCGYWSAVWAYK